VKRLTNASASSATSRQPLSMVSACPWPGDLLDLPAAAPPTVRDTEAEDAVHHLATGGEARVNRIAAGSRSLMLGAVRP
jgi:hypothetical protein